MRSRIFAAIFAMVRPQKRRGKVKPAYRTILGLAVLVLAFNTRGAFAQQPGTQRWSVGGGPKFEASPAIGADGTIYIGTSGSPFRDANYLYAINPADGSTKWATNVDPLGVGQSLGIGSAA